MKSLLIKGIFIAILSLSGLNAAPAQIPVIDIIKAGVTKVIKAMDLKIQRLQNKTIWLQNAQKTLENEMSKLKLGEISSWAEKQKELYSSYFDELWKVKSSINTYKKVRDIVSMEAMVVKEYKVAIKRSFTDKHFTKDELKYMQEIYSGIIAESLKNLEGLHFAITAYVSQMSDGKRLELIEKNYAQAERTLTDLREFNNQNAKISLQRSKNQIEIDVVRKLYDLN